MESVNVLFNKLSKLPKNIEVDFRNGDVLKDGVVVTRIFLTSRGISNLLTAVKLGLI